MDHTDDESAANCSCPEFSELRQKVGRRSFLSGLATFLLVAGQACRSAIQPPAEITLVLIDQTWLDNALQDWRDQELRQFTKETGVRVKLLPAPEGAEPLDAWRRFLESGAKIPDVYGVDVIWPGILADNLLDLRNLVPATEIATHFPELIANNTVNGKMVALPCLIDVGLLYYRTDLLKHYGYDSTTNLATARNYGHTDSSGRAGQGPKGLLGFRVGGGIV